MSEVRQPQMPNGELIDREYLRRCKAMSHQERFEAMIGLMKFYDTAMSEKAKSRARKLREMGW
jgi:hypothetical protein